MATSDEIKQRALELSEKTDSNSITPKEVGGIMHDLASLGENAIRNGGTLGIRKVYESVAAMEADNISPVDLWRNPIKKGNLVVIYDGTTTGTDNNKVYAFMNPGWELATYLDAGYATRSEVKHLSDEVASKADAEETNEKLSELASEVSKNIQFYMQQGIFLMTSGKLAVNNNYKSSDYIRIKEGSTYIIEGITSSVKYDQVAVAFYSDISENNYIGYLSESYISDSSCTINAENTPSSCKYIKVCALSTQNTKIVNVDSMQYSIENEIKPEITDIKRNLYEDEVIIEENVSEGYIRTNGSVYPSSTYGNTGFIKVTPSKTYIIENIISQTQYTMVGVAFYDESKSYIGRIENSDVKANKAIIKPNDFVSGAAYIRCSSVNLTVKVKVTSKTIIGELKEQLSSAKPFTPLCYLPQKIYAVNGEKVQIFNRSIVNAFNIDRFNVKYSLVSGSWLYFQNKGRYIEADIENGDGNIQIKASINSETEKLSESNICEVVVKSKASSPTTMKNVLLIGDSLTDQNVYPHELHRRLCNDVATNEDWGDLQTPLIQSDNLVNINFIGTRNGVGVNYKPNTPYNEGYSGKDYNFFVSAESPFYYNGAVDFNSYMSSGKVKGTIQNVSNGKIDIAVIILGTNRANSESSIKSLWRKLIEHNPSIKIIVSGRILCSTIGLGKNGGLSYNGRNLYRDSWYDNEGLFDYNTKLEMYANEDEFKDNVYYVDINSQFDSEYNYPYEEQGVNRRNLKIKERVGNDSVHPSIYGYWQMADVVYNAIHCIGIQ